MSSIPVHNYLNNRDMLAEIHKSKVTYCSYLQPEYSEYDIIINNLHQIDSDLIDEAKKAKATRLQRKAYDESIKAGIKRKQDEFAVDPNTLATTDLVFRLMTWDHIPYIQAAKPESPKWLDDIDSQETEYDDVPVVQSPTKKPRLNFPPFQHYKITDNFSPYLVGKSHWKGTIANGEYCKDHGKMTNALAKIFVLMCNRYVSKANFRNYSYADEMVSQGLMQLSQVGLQFDESKGSNAFAYITTVIHNAFIRVLNSEKKNQNIRDEILEDNGYDPSYTRQNQIYDDYE